MYKQHTTIRPVTGGTGRFPIIREHTVEASTGSLRHGNERCDSLRPSRAPRVSLAGSRVVIVGGNANNGSNDGPAYFNVNNSLGNANANIGVRPTNRFSNFYTFRSPCTGHKVNRYSPYKTLVPRWKTSGKPEQLTVAL